MQQEVIEIEVVIEVNVKETTCVKCKEKEKEEG